MNSDAPNFRAMLAEEFELRACRNSAYSLRSFARDIGISHSSLCRVIKGEQGLSSSLAGKIATRIGFESTEAQVFLNSVRYECSRSKAVRETAGVAFHSSNAENIELKLEYFKTVSDWYHFAILELSETKGFQSAPHWIARRLSITPKEAAEAMDRLLKLNLLVRVGEKVKRVKGLIATPSGISSRSIRNRHHQILKKAEDALENQSVDEREFSSMTLSLNPEDLPWIKEELRKFRRKLANRIVKAPNRNRVYEVSMALFALDHPELEIVKGKKI